MCEFPEVDVEELDEADMVEVLPESGDRGPSTVTSQTGTKRRELLLLVSLAVVRALWEEEGILLPHKSTIDGASTSAVLSPAMQLRRASILPQLPPMAREQVRHLVRITETITRDYHDQEKNSEVK